MSDRAAVPSSRMRLLFAVPFSPRPDAHHGGGRAIAQLVHELAGRHSVAVVYLRRPDSPPIDPRLAARCDLVEEVPLADHGPWRRRLLTLATPLTGAPPAVALLRSDEFVGAVLRTAERWHPDVIQIEHDVLASLGPSLRDRGDSAPRVLSCHEPGVLASEDQARVARGRRRLAHRLDAAGWRRHWSRTLSSFDAIVTLTERDGALLAAAVSGPRIVSIGLGTEIPEVALSPTGRGEPSVLYVGGYRHPPNIDAGMRLISSIMPEVRSRMPGLRLLLVGADPGPQLTEAASPDDTITGAVPSVRPFLDDAAVVALPIRLGGGMRVKLLEALAAGKAVVASPLAAAGLDLTDGEQIVLAETDEEFADAILKLLGDRDARSALGGSARQWAQRNLSWEAGSRRYEGLYRALSAPPAGQG